jgi:hypothetical protein
VSETLCPECGSERTDFTKVCPACGAPPAPEHRQGESPGGVRGHDLEPYITLRYIAKLFKVLALLIIIMLFGEVLTGLLIDGTTAVVTLLGEGTRLLVMAGLLWAGGDLALLFIDAGHDLRVARILLGRINAQMHRSDPGAGLLPGDTQGAGAGGGRGASPPAAR